MSGPRPRTVIKGFLWIAFIAIAMILVFILTKDEKPDLYYGSTGATTSSPEATSPTIVGSRPDSSERNPACQVIPLAQAQRSLQDTALEVITTVTTPDGGHNCLYGHVALPGTTVLGTTIYPESAGTFRASLQLLRQQYIEQTAAHNPYYGHAFVRVLSPKRTKLSGATGAFFVHTAKYGHDYMFVNDGRYSLRLWMRPYSKGQSIALAKLALANMKRLGM